MSLSSDPPSNDAIGRSATTDLEAMTIALEEAGVEGPNVPGLFDPSGYTGVSGPLVDRALARFENVLNESSHG